MYWINFHVIHESFYEELADLALIRAVDAALVGLLHEFMRIIDDLYRYLPGFSLAFDRIFLGIAFHFMAGYQLAGFTCSGLDVFDLFHIKTAAGGY